MHISITLILPFLTSILALLTTDNPPNATESSLSAQLTARDDKYPYITSFKGSSCKGAHIGPKPTIPTGPHDCLAFSQAPGADLAGVYYGSGNVAISGLSLFTDGQCKDHYYDAGKADDKGIFCLSDAGNVGSVSVIATSTSQLTTRDDKLPYITSFKGSSCKGKHIGRKAIIPGINQCVKFTQDPGADHCGVFYGSGKDAVNGLSFFTDGACKVDAGIDMGASGHGAEIGCTDCGRFGSVMVVSGMDTFN